MLSWFCKNLVIFKATLKNPDWHWQHCGNRPIYTYDAEDEDGL